MKRLAALIILLSADNTFAAIDLDPASLIATIASTQVTNLSTGQQRPESEVFQDTPFVIPSGMTRSNSFLANTQVLGFNLHSTVSSDFAFTPTNPVKITASGSGNTSSDI